MKALFAAVLLVLWVTSANADPANLLPGDNADSSAPVSPAPGLLITPEEGCGKGSAIPCPSATGVEKSVQVLAAGAKVPATEINDLDGKPFMLVPEGAAKPTLVIFWSLFCEPCKEEFPLFCQIGSDYAQKGLETVTVNLDGPDLAKTAKGFLKMNKSTLTAAVDRKEGKRSLAAEVYGVSGTPSIFLIGKDGVVRWSHVGRVEPEKLETEIKSALGS